MIFEFRLFGKWKIYLIPRATLILKQTIIIDEHNNINYRVVFVKPLSRSVRLRRLLQLKSKSDIVLASKLLSRFCNW